MRRAPSVGSLLGGSTEAGIRTFGGRRQVLREAVQRRGLDDDGVLATWGAAEWLQCEGIILDGSPYSMLDGSGFPKPYPVMEFGTRILAYGLQEFHSARCT